MKIKPLNTLLTSTVLLLSATVILAQPAYFQAVTNLNPVGYWPMHEIEPGVHGDIETNYGTLGTLGTGFYGDWATLGNTPVVHGATPGCIANDASETCVNFSQVISAASVGGFTNGIYVSHASPLTTLNPPFSVECWVNGPGGGNDKQADVWSQAGSAGFNGGPNLAGMRLHWGNVGFTIYTYNGVNGGTLVTLLSYNSISANTWYHTVVTDDGTNITLWVNGVAERSAPQAGNFAPDYWSPLAIDNGPGGGTPYKDSFSGRIDQFAVYTNALTQDQITNDYTVGVTTSSATNYYNTIISNNPVIYFQMDSPTISAEPAGPTLTNYGSAAINGSYHAEVLPGGAPGPGVLGAGFGAANAMPANFASGFADVGDSSSYNPTGASTNFSVTAWFKGDPADSRAQSIVGHGTNSWQLGLTKNGLVVFNSGTNSASMVATGTGAGDLVSPNVYNDGLWHQVVATHSITTNTLYLDGVPVATNNSSVSIPGSASDVLIGSDPAFTNNPVAGQGVQFAGEICEVAYFATNLAASQVLSLYNASEMAPVISQRPVSATVNAGNAFTNTVAAIGVSPLAYQWYTNGVALAGQTNASLILNPVAANDASTDYYVVVTNSYGSATSAPPVTLAVQTGTTIVGQFPITYSNILNTNFMTLYAGADPTFSISSIGAPPIYYFWYTNGVLDGDATNASLTLTNVQLGSISDYCIVSNFLGMATSAVWSASIIADPTNSIGGLAPYPQAVLSLNPIAYWRLNESDDTAGNEGVIAHDYASGNNGLYTNVILGQMGYSTTDPSGTSMEVGSGSYTINSYVGSIGTNIDVSAPAGSNVEYSIECWANVQANGSGIVAKGRGGGGEEFVLGTVPNGSSLGTKNTYMFYLRQPGFNNFFVADSSVIPNGNWVHLVGVCDEAHTNLTLYINGQTAATTYVPTNSGVVSDTSPMTIGVRDSSAGSGNDLQSIGTISDVALFNYALTSDQVLNEYNQSGIAPYFIQQPSTTYAVQGSDAMVTAIAGGTSPLVYQWYETNLTAMTGYAVAGQTNATLIISNIAAGDSYYLNVTNILGATNSIAASVVVYSYPVINGGLPITYTNSGSTNFMTLYAHANPKFSVSAIGLGTLSYQWYTNGVAIGNATGTNVALNDVGAGLLNTYCVVSNSLGTATNLWVASVIADPTNASGDFVPYPQAVLSLHPIGYWRLNEPDDGVGDYNAGVIAHDYVGGNDGIYTNMILGQSAFDSDLYPNETSALFGFVAFVNCDAYGITGIDFSSPTNISKSFSVEAWVNGYQQTLDAGIVTKGYGGGGEQFDLDTGGPTNINQSTPHNFRFLVRDASGTAHSVNSGIQPGSIWHHLVGVCDEANSNLTFYIDGQVVGTATIAPGSGILASPWPTCIGSRSTSLAKITAGIYDNQFVGNVGDVAVFNYALTATQVTNEYQGIIAAVTVNQNPTNIITSVSGSQLTLSWPADHIGWQLQVQTNNLSVGISTNWVDVANSDSTNQVVIPINPTNGCVLYRLVYPQN